MLVRACAVQWARWDTPLSDALLPVAGRWLIRFPFVVVCVAIVCTGAARQQCADDRVLGKALEGGRRERKARSRATAARAPQQQQQARAVAAMGVDCRRTAVGMVHCRTTLLERKHVAMRGNSVD